MVIPSILSAAEKQHKVHQEFVLNSCSKCLITSSQMAACEVEHRFISANGESRHTQTQYSYVWPGFNGMQ